jgi:hypothetical protein
MYFMEPMNSSRKPPLHRVLCTFFSCNGWCVSFLEQDGKTTLPRKLTFATPDKIIEIHTRWGEDRDTNALQRAIQMGRGSFFLMLTAEQYNKLK